MLWDAAIAAAKMLPLLMLWDAAIAAVEWADAPSDAQLQVIHLTSIIVKIKKTQCRQWTSNGLKKWVAVTGMFLQMIPWNIHLLILLLRT
jgi:hypothetical protein